MENNDLTYKFTPEQLQWLDALESGKYQQGFFNLNYDGKFSCLGVACDVFKDQLTVQVAGNITSYNGLGFVMPYKIINLLKLNGYTGLINSTRDELIPESSLVKMNDFERRSFKEIAKYIRENPEKVFKE